MTPEETRILMEIASDAADTRRSLQDLKKELLDNGQPGFITLTRKRLTALEYSDAKRKWLERAATVAVSAIVSACIALLHGFSWRK